MPLSSKIREQIISSFRAELAEHTQTLNDGLLALEQHKVSGKEREELLGNVFRAAHSLKGAARAVGVGAIEQLSHALEDVLGGLQHDSLEATPALFTACYKAIDAIQAVQTAYEAGETTPPIQALQALTDLDTLRKKPEGLQPAKEPPAPKPEEEAPAAKAESTAKTASAKKNQLEVANTLDDLFTQIDQEVNGQAHEPVVEAKQPAPAPEPEPQPAPPQPPSPQAQPATPASTPD